MKGTNEILEAFDLKPSQFQIKEIKTGHIHSTFHLTGAQEFILQKVNTKVFKKPELISANLSLARNYLQEHFPQYLFTGNITTKDGKGLFYDAQGNPWRLFPYNGNTYSIDRVEAPEQAQSAAREFATFARCLSGCDVSSFRETIPHFHDLAWRYKQFERARENSNRLSRCGDAVRQVETHRDLVRQYQELIHNGSLSPRIMHNDTKINNVLFDRTTGEAVCVIDLDTVMPGFFIYDLGDMIRTFVCPVDENESNLDLITIRDDLRKLTEEAYVNELKDVLTREELKAIDFAGPMMTYIMAIRFLTDYLEGDQYFRTAYPEQNLFRARNQLKLLELLRTGAT
jgi:hypothetical protein